MKYSILFLIVMSSLFATAQNNLQFNQVVRVKNTGTSASNTAYYTMGNITVPTGSVYKIEAASVYLSLGTGAGAVSGNSAMQLLVDGEEVYSSVPSSSGSFFGSIYLLPMWLGPGTYSIALDFGTTTGTGLTFTTVLDGLQFNVVQ